MKTKLIDTIKTIFPSNRREVAIFLFFILSYGILATIIASNYTIVFDNRIPWDAYFSFDNRAIVMTGGGFERHPLANYFFDALRKFSLWLSNGKMDDVFRLSLAWFSVIAMSLTMVQIFKYIRNIIRLPFLLSLFLVLFFALFSTNILLSFTPETYTYTLLLLSGFVYYSALKMRKNEKIPLPALSFGVISVGGLTITNAVKVFLPLLYERNWYKNSKAFLGVLWKSVVSVGVFVLLYLYRLDFDYQRIFSKTTEQYEKFSQPKVTPIWDMITSWFFGGNVLFPSFILRDYHNKKGFEYKALFMDTYDSVGGYIFVFLLLFFVLWSFIRNFKKPMVQILILSFLVDIIIHCVLKFGLHTSYIYGGHFVFVYPLMLAWLLFSYKNSPKIFTAILGVFALMFIYLAINNMVRMQEFFAFLNQYYSVKN
ncbi:MAG: DUF6080 domain-containing protein [Bergeyella zoohelcum]|nr:DUF6080 domain-containing protein [Bergeyella zoohelcum]